jgi:hypothetical protein
MVLSQSQSGHSEPGTASNSESLTVSKSGRPVDFDTLFLPLPFQENRLCLTGNFVLIWYN